MEIDLEHYLLRWKLPFLAEGYRLATLEISDVVSAEDVAHAEIPRLAAANGHLAM
jgi:hypothetical protein